MMAYQQVDTSLSEDFVDLVDDAVLQELAAYATSGTMVASTPITPLNPPARQIATEVKETQTGNHPNAYPADLDRSIGRATSVGLSLVGWLIMTLSCEENPSNPNSLTEKYLDSFRNPENKKSVNPWKICWEIYFFLKCRRLSALLAKLSVGYLRHGQKALIWKQESAALLAARVQPVDEARWVADSEIKIPVRHDTDISLMVPTILAILSKVSSDPRLSIRDVFEKIKEELAPRNFDERLLKELTNVASAAFSEVADRILEEARQGFVSRRRSPSDITVDPAIIHTWSRWLSV